MDDDITIPTSRIISAGPSAMNNNLRNSLPPPLINARNTQSLSNDPIPANRKVPFLLPSKNGSIISLPVRPPENNLVKGNSEFLDKPIVNYKEEKNFQTQPLKVNLPPNLFFPQGKTDQISGGLVDKNSCSKCKKKLNNSESEKKKKLACKHSFCKECTGDLIDEYLKDHIYYSLKSNILGVKIRCPFCNIVIPENFFEKEEKFIDYKRKIKEKYVMITNNYKKCLNCQEFYPQSSYFTEDVCKHLCKNCLITTLSNKIKNCEYCEEELPDLLCLVLNKRTCFKCRNEKSLMKMVINLCKHHIFCRKCAEKVIDENECPTCRTAFSEETISNTKKYIQSQQKQALP